MQVTAVINYDVPWDPVNNKADTENYVHRIGRCGRFGRRGIAINFVYDIRSRNNLDDIIANLGCKIENLPTDDDEELEKLLVL